VHSANYPQSPVRPRYDTEQDPACSGRGRTERYIKPRTSSCSHYCQVNIRSPVMQIGTALLFCFRVGIDSTYIASQSKMLRTKLAQYFLNLFYR
jgi:hypothetical protein